MRCFIRLSTISLLLFAFASQLHAQGASPDKQEMPWYGRIFSVYPLVEKKPEEKKWFLSIGGWYEQKWGNTETSRSRGSLDYTYNNGISSINFISRVFYGKYAGIENENNGKAISRIDHFIHPRVEIFLLGINEYDRMAGIEYRTDSGAGAKFVFMRNELLRSDISLAPLFQYENYMVSGDRSESRLSLRYRFTMTIWRLTGTLVYFYIPRTTQWKDYRTELVSSLGIKLADLGLTQKNTLNLRLDYIRKYNSRPPEGIKRSDDSLTLQLVLEF